MSSPDKHTVQLDGIHVPDLERTASTVVEGEFEKSEQDYEVYLEDGDDPKNLSSARKWTAVFVISAGSMCVTCVSSMAAFTEEPMALEFKIPVEVTVLGISLFVLGFGSGNLFIGPVSEVYGRNILYQVSFFLFWVFSWPVAFAPHIAVYLLFRFLVGFCGAAFFSVAGGSVSDLFTNSQVGTPMAIYSLSPFLGPVLGPLISGFINQNTNWRWTYYVVIIWSFVQFIALCFLVPETYVPVILKKKAQRLRKSTGDDQYWAPLEKENHGMARNITLSCLKAFQIPFYERMALLLDLWTALVFGILYLTFEAFPIIFRDVHGFNVQMTGLTFLGMGVGMMIAVVSQPLWNRLNTHLTIKHNGNPPPESRLIMAQVAAILMPIGLFWQAFTTYKHVHWIVPIIASILFGTGICFAFTSTFTYLVVAYRPVAASAMAGNAFIRSIFAFAFPLFAGYMYNRLGTVGATALLAGLATVLAPLPFIFYKIGARLRQNSRFATK